MYIYWRILLQYKYYMDNNCRILFKEEYKSQEIGDFDIGLIFNLFKNTGLYKESVT